MLAVRLKILNIIQRLHRGSTPEYKGVPLRFLLTMDDGAMDAVRCLEYMGVVSVDGDGIHKRVKLRRR